MYDVQITEEWCTPDEESVDAEDQYSNSLMVKQKSISMPPELRRILGEVPPRKQRKSEPIPKSGWYSLQAQRRNRRRSSVVDPKTEDTARRYSKTVTEDSLKHLRRTIRIAGSIAEKGSDINKELVRQDRVILTAEIDTSIAEYEIDRAAEVLMGMSSIRRKFATVVKKKKPTLKVRPYRNINMDLINGEVSLSAFSRMSNCKSSIPSKHATDDTDQKQLKEGIGHLNQALDVISLQQMDAAWALDRHEERLSVFEDQISTINRKINSQTQISQIMGKS